MLAQKTQNHKFYLELHPSLPIFAHMKTSFFAIVLPLLTLCLLNSCREDIMLWPGESEKIPGTETQTGESMYLLCEGNMGTNKASLDRLEINTMKYIRNFYALANPKATKELGDVGNDLGIYGQKLWVVVNASNKIEVMKAHNGERITHINLPNCRYIAFDGPYAYVSSYAGPIGLGHRQRGYVAKIDTLSLSIVDTCVVGFQPDGICAAEGKLYVCNSGGYNKPDYETTLSVIDLHSFQEKKRLEIAPNLCHVVHDNHNALWISSRGNYTDIPPTLIRLDLKTQRVTHRLPLSVQALWIQGDSLYLTGQHMTQSGPKAGSQLYGIVNTQQAALVCENFISDGTHGNIRTPYGISVHPTTKDIFLCDARDYVSPGTLHCYSPQGKLKWSIRTGDIPSRMVFLSHTPPLHQDSTTKTSNNAYATKVFAYCPAPGQFVNQLPPYEAGDTHESMCRKAQEAICSGAGGMISLGGWGGYVILGFDHEVPNQPNTPDIRILGNAFYSTTGSDAPRQRGSAEPGIVYVSQDINSNGRPDDPWYEISGSQHNAPTTLRTYNITYSRQYTADNTEKTNRQQERILWQDNQGESGEVLHNSFHTQPYYPLWVNENMLSFSGTRLESNVIKEENNYVFYTFGWGYADNHPNGSPRSAIDLDWAVDSTGKPVHLSGIHFLRIMTGIKQQNEQTGEVSTEVCGAIDLHMHRR